MQSMSVGRTFCGPRVPPKTLKRALSIFAYKQRRAALKTCNRIKIQNVNGLEREKVDGGDEEGVGAGQDVECGPVGGHDGRDMDDEELNSQLDIVETALAVVRTRRGLSSAG